MHQTITGDSKRTRFVAVFLLGLGAIVSAHPHAQTTSPLTPHAGEIVATVRLLTYNVFGVYKPFGEDERCNFRYTHFGDILARRNPVSDVIGLQEYFGNSFLGLFPGNCNPEPLRESITATGRYLTTERHPCVPLLFEFPPYVNGCRFQPRKGLDGGIGLLTQHHIESAESWRWNEHTNQLRSQGFLFARIRLVGTTSNTPLRLDVYVVHILGECTPRPSCQRHELEQLAGEIAELSALSGNPVIVMGDFNLDGPRRRADVSSFPEYRHILETLRNPRDLWLEAHPAGVAERGLTTDECPLVRPVFGSPELEPDTFQCSGSTTLCGCTGKRIDYMFLITDPSMTNNPFDVRFAHPDDVRVVRFFELDDGPVRVSVSDHYGVDAVLQVRKPQTVAPTN